VARRNSGRRARSRKRRQPAAGVAAKAPPARGGNERESVAGAASPAGAPPTARAARRRPPAPARASAGGFKDPQSLGERPQAPWHPLPLSELLILVGIVGVVVGLSRTTPTTALAGVAAVLLGTAEVSWREHRSGYRAHALLLALLPTVVFHSAVVLLASAFVRVPRVVNLALLPIDAALFAALFKLLRARFQDARRERVFAGSR